MSRARAFLLLELRGGRQGRGSRLAEESHKSLDVLGYRGQEELLPHELQSPQAQTTQPDLMLEFREQGFHLFSLSLGMGEGWRVDQLPRTLSGGFVLVDDKTPEGSTGTLWSERAWATLFACPDVVEGAIPINSSSIVERLASGTD